MKKMKNRSALYFALIFAVLTGMFPVSSFAAGYTNDSYSYNYDYWGEEIPTPDSYYVKNIFAGIDLGIGNFKEPQGIFIRDNRIYICDTGNSRVVLIEYDGTNNKYNLIKTVGSVMINGEESVIKSPYDLFETQGGEIFIADTDNQRILRLDKDFNYINSINKPTDTSFSENTEFLPCKLVVDPSNRLFAQVRNVNKGFVEFTVDGEFIGYIGASRVNPSLADIFWKAIATDAQRARMELFVPTEYNNLCLDYDGFLYATLSTFKGDIEKADPVRRLNAVGSDILVRNGYGAPIGDWNWWNKGGVSGPSKFCDVVAFKNNSYACLDRSRGRIFTYDFQGNILYIFGGIGNKDGRFLDAVGMDEMGYDIFVLDSRACSVTHFSLTEYGTHINEAMNYYYNGLYEKSAEEWDNVLKFNGSYDLAYIGKGRSALLRGDYKEAMELFEIKNDEKNYGKSFQLYRKQWIEERIVPIIFILIGLYVIVKGLRLVIRIRGGKGGEKE